MSDNRPSDDRNGCFLDARWCCKVCDGEIPTGHADNCDVWALEERIRTLEAALRKIVTMDPCVDWCHFDGDEEEGTDILSIARAALAPAATEEEK